MATYPDLSSEAFRHPLDCQAEQALRSLPGFKLLAQNFVEYVYERPQQIFLLGNNLKASPRQYGSLYGIFQDCVQDLDIDPEPSLFINQSPQVNSHALGHEKPYIVVNTGLLELLNEQEIRTVLAHELGHIKCDHTILIQMALWAMGAASFLGDLTFGIGNIVSTGLIYAFYEWRRKAELSADRAALLVMEDVQPLMQTMVKLAGGSGKYAREISVEEFERQADDYQNLNGDNLNQVYKFLLANGGNGSFLSHPFPVERLHHLKQWARSPEYEAIRQGNYVKKSSPGDSGNPTPENRDEVESLQAQLASLQAEIDRIKQNREPE